MTSIAKTNGRGAPTKYNEQELYPKIEEYIVSCSREQTSLPTVEGLALYLGLTTETLYQWMKKYPQLSDAIKKILMKQKTQLMNDGMYGGKEVNAAMAIFLLKVNHGMKENDPSTLVQQNQVIVIPSELLEKYGITPNTKPGR